MKSFDMKSFAVCAALLRGDLVNGFVRGKLGYKGTFIADAGAIGALSRALWTDADFQIGLRR